MGRVTFQDPGVIRRINRDFVATWRNVQPGYRVEHLEGRRFEEIKRIPNGQASENVATLFCTAGGELLHVAPGHWKPKDYVREMNFAESVARAVARAGSDPNARRQAARKLHQERLAALEGDRHIGITPFDPGELGRLVLEGAHERMIQQPLRSAADVRSVTDYALDANHNLLAQKVHSLQQALRKRQAAGQDLRQVAPIMDGFDALLHAGNLAAAEARVDRALALLGVTFVPEDMTRQPASPSPPEVPVSIRQKMQRVTALADQWRHEGRDLTPAAQVLNHVEPLMRQRDFRGAEAVLDQGLRILESPKPGVAGPRRQPSALSPDEMLKAEAIHQKMQRVTALAHQWQREGRDLTPVARILNSVGRLLQQGDSVKAEAALDAGLRILQTPAGDSGRNAPRGPSQPSRKPAAGRPCYRPGLRRAIWSSDGCCDAVTGPPAPYTP